MNHRCQNHHNLPQMNVCSTLETSKLTIKMMDLNEQAIQKMLVCVSENKNGGDFADSVLMV